MNSRVVEEDFCFKLKGICRVYIDWANVVGWEKTTKTKIDPALVYTYLQSYSNIEHINFYYGLDKHPKSQAFLKRIKRIGFHTYSKPVKYLTLSKKPLILKRKCDFDLEIALTAISDLSQTDSFIFFSGDGDFAPLYQKLITAKKQVVVVYAKNHIGKEIWELGNKVYMTNVVKLYKKIVPRTESRA